MRAAVISTWATSSSPRGSGCIIAETAWPTTGWPRSWGTKPFDVLFLPINGRDPARGVPGNMTAAEAVDLATRVRPRLPRASPLRYVYVQHGSRRDVRGRGPPAAGGRSSPASCDAASAGRSRRERHSGHRHRHLGNQDAGHRRDGGQSSPRPRPSIPARTPTRAGPSRIPSSGGTRRSRPCSRCWPRASFAPADVAGHRPVRADARLGLP